MKQFIAILLFIGAGLGLSAQTINDQHAEKRQVGNFHGIDVGTGIELLLTQGNTEDVAVSAATPEFRDRIITRVENGILKIHYETKTGAINKTRENKDLKAYVSFKSLDRLHASTGAEVTISGVLQSTTLDMQANTGATINGKVDLGSLKLEQNTGSKVTLTGKTGQVDAEGSTGSKFTGEDMTTTSCKVQVSTGARFTIHASKELEAKASTGAIVRYKGEAGIKSVKANTGGTVTRI